MPGLRVGAELLPLVQAGHARRPVPVDADRVVHHAPGGGGIGIVEHPGVERQVQGGAHARHLRARIGDQVLVAQYHGPVPQKRFRLDQARGCVEKVGREVGQLRPVFLDVGGELRGQHGEGIAEQQHKAGVGEQPVEVRNDQAVAGRLVEKSGFAVPLEDRAVDLPGEGPDSGVVGLGAVGIVFEKLRNPGGRPGRAVVGADPAAPQAVDGVQHQPGFRGRLHVRVARQNSLEQGGPGSGHRDHEDQVLAEIRVRNVWLHDGGWLRVIRKRPDRRASVRLTPGLFVNKQPPHGLRVRLPVS